MELKESYLKKFTIKSMSPSQESFFRRQKTCEDISKWSRGKLPIPMLMKFMATKGERFVRQIWEEVRHSEAREPFKLFKWKYAQCKPKMEEVNELKAGIEK